VAGRRAQPTIWVVAGPNGGGKSSIFGEMVRQSGADYYNADEHCARLLERNPGLAREAANALAWEEGRRRLEQAVEKGESFAFETTLASRTFAPWIEFLVRGGYSFDLVFLWLSSPELAMARVAERVRMGGHSVPEDVIRRRYTRGLQNFFRLYRPLASRWHFIDNSGATPGRPIAEGAGEAENRVQDGKLWKQLVDRWA